MPFTAEELAEMARADAEIEAEFFVTNEEFAESRQRDRAATLEAMEPARRRIAESKRRYRAANKEKLAESHRRYYAANKEKLAESQRRYYAANKEKVAESKRAIQAARKAAGLTQVAAARLLGVTQSTISIWENISAPEHWQEIVATLLAQKEKAAAGAGTSHDRSH